MHLLFMNSHYNPWGEIYKYVIHEYPLFLVGMMDGDKTKKLLGMLVFSILGFHDKCLCIMCEPLLIIVF